MHQVGDLIDGKYAVAAVYTNGGMGIVYKVYQASWQINMAMKCPRAELFKEEIQKKTFVAECETWMKLGVHPNIVTCYYVADVDSVPAVFAEFVDGGTLLDCIRTRELYGGTSSEVLERILDVAIQTVRGLSYAHHMGYIHQDVKPANVLMMKDGVAKVSDFGLAKAKGGVDKKSLTSDGRSMVVSSGGWTPAYGSPEQALGRPLTRRTDIWSWAVMVLEMVHGSMFWKIGPYASRALDELWPWQIFDKSVQKCKPLLALIRSCLAERESDRPKDFDTIEKSLSEIYQSVFKRDYARPIPPEEIMTEISLNNQIVGYAELSKNGEDQFSKMYDRLARLRKVAPWSVWGPLNYALYMWREGKPLKEVLPLVENQIQYVETYDAAKWIAELLLKWGVTSLRHETVGKLIAKAPTVQKYFKASHDYLRARLREIFRHEAPIRHPDKFDNEEVYSRDEDGRMIFCAADSENGKCHVIVRSSITTAEFDCDRIVELKISFCASDKVFKCDVTLPRDAKIKFATVDDSALKISLWIDRYGRGHYQVVIGLQGEKLVQYRTDYRKVEPWGEPTNVYLTGDSKTMMLCYDRRGDGFRCSIWHQHKSGPGDGKEICRIDLCSFGLFPRRSDELALEDESGFGYNMSRRAACAMMRLFVAVLCKGEYPYYLIRPESYFEIFTRWSTGRRILEDGILAGKRGEAREEVRKTAESIAYGVMPDDAMLARRHSKAVACRDCYVRKVWRRDSSDSYWSGGITRLIPSLDGNLAIFAPDGRTRSVQLTDCTATPHVGVQMPLRMEDYLTQRAFFIGYCSNGDVLFALTDAEMRRVFAVTRYAVSREATELSQQCRQVWKTTFADEVSLLRFEYCLQFDGEYLGVYLSDSKDEIALLSVETGAVVWRGKGFHWNVRCWHLGFSESCEIRAVVCHGKRDPEFTVLDRDLKEVSGERNRLVFLLQKYKNIVAISKSADRILIRHEWGASVVFAATGERKLIYDGHPYKMARPYYYRELAMSPNGNAVAVLTVDYRLLVFDVNSASQVFAWQVESGKYNEMVFDSTSRWLALLRDGQKIETFELFWSV